MQRERIKTLEEILRDNPEAKAYWNSVRSRQADPVPEFDTPVCSVCGGVGFVRVDLPVSHPRFGELFPCPNPDCETTKAQRATRYAKLATRSQIPAEYQGAEVSFDGWAELEQIPEAIEGKRGALGAALAFVAAKARGYKFSLEEAAEICGIAEPTFASNPKCSIVFTGENGMGKTSLAVSVGKLLLDEGVAVVYLRMAEFFDGLKERFREKDAYEIGGDASDEAEFMRQYQQAPVLILDEFSADATDWRREKAESLINYRYTHQLPTIFTTNMDAPRMIHEWGLTLGSRVQAMAHWVEVGGVELRERAKVWISR